MTVPETGWHQPEEEGPKPTKAWMEIIALFQALPHHMACQLADQITADCAEAETTGVVPDWFLEEWLGYDE